VERKDGLIIPGSSRGFYVEGREDHLVPAFFENFTLLPDFQWLERVLDRLAVTRNGGIINASWSYSYSELIPGRGRPHADIVIMWRDDGGDALLVIEAKRPGCGPKGCGEKDDPANLYYLHYAAMRRIERRSQALLLDDSDLRTLPERVKSNPAVITWQDLIRIQLDFVTALSVDRQVKEWVIERLTAHYAELGLIAAKGPIPVARGDAASYAQIRALDAPDCIKDWLIGSELYFAARSPGGVIEPPYEWLANEPTILDYAREKRQTTAEREMPIWHLNGAGNLRPQ
jgi:hypothetical protein